jgi:hypothetical protein
MALLTRSRHAQDIRWTRPVAPDFGCPLNMKWKRPKAQGLDIPPTPLATADDLIE